MPKRGLPFECGHGVDEVGTPFSECPDCQEKTKNAIARWETKKRVEKKLNRGECPFDGGHMETKTLALPAEDHVPAPMDGIPMDLSMIVFGPPKVGKTQFGASFPKSILLECEPGGAKYQRCRKLDIESYDQLKEAYKLLSKDKTYETIVIDSLDRVAQWIEAEICREMGIGHIMAAKKGQKHGEQWGEYVKRALAFLEAWKHLGKRMIFLAHTKKVETDGDGLVISPKTINLYGQAANRVVSIVDNIGHLYAKDDNGKTIRVLSFKPGVHVEAGSRHPALADKMIEIPAEKGYTTFEALFKTNKKNGGKK